MHLEYMCIYLYCTAHVIVIFSYHIFKHWIIKLKVEKTANTVQQNTSCIQETLVHQRTAVLVCYILILYVQPECVNHSIHSILWCTNIKILVEVIWQYMCNTLFTRQYVFWKAFLNGVEGVHTKNNWQSASFYSFCTWWVGDYLVSESPYTPLQKWLKIFKIRSITNTS